jgi:hypothetical protein
VEGGSKGRARVSTARRRKKQMKQTNNKENVENKWLNETG